MAEYLDIPVPSDPKDYKALLLALKEQGEEGSLEALFLGKLKFSDGTELLLNVDTHSFESLLNKKVPKGTLYLFARVWPNGKPKASNDNGEKEVSHRTAAEELRQEILRILKTATEAGQRLRAATIYHTLRKSPAWNETYRAAVTNALRVLEKRREVLKVTVEGHAPTYTLAPKKKRGKVKAPKRKRAPVQHTEEETEYAGPSQSIRDQVERKMKSFRRKANITLDELCTDIPDLTRKQIRDAMDYFCRQGVFKRADRGVFSRS